VSGGGATALCAGGGLGLATLGIVMIRSAEPKEGETRFVSAFSPTTLLHSGGYIALFAGLLLAVMVAPMIYLSH